MLNNIPTYVVAGALGVGKTSLIRHLLAHKPAHERWAVLINEFGQIGLDAALLHTGADGIGLAEVAGGCLCCVNGAPFNVALSRLLRQSQPHRLFIEPSGLGHPAALLRQLDQAPWVGVLALQAPLLVLDAQALARGQPLPESLRETLPLAGCVVLNKSAVLGMAERAQLAAQLAGRDIVFTEYGALEVTRLLAASAQSKPAAARAVAPETPTLWRDPQQVQWQVNDRPEGWSIGWRWHPSQRFDLAALESLLAHLPWRRAKAVLHGATGWQALNAVQGEGASTWRVSEWRRDSRLELIFAQAQEAHRLTAAVDACRLATLDAPSN